MKKKRFLIFFAAIAAVVICACTVSSFLVQRLDRTFLLPKADNETPLEELITRRYSEEALQALYVIDEHGIEYVASMQQIKRRFKIECVRDPREFNKDEEWLPYIVLLSEDGRKIFVFYNPEDKEDTWLVQFYDLKSTEETIAYVETLTSSGIDINDWWRDLGDIQNGGCTGSLTLEEPILTKEGMLVVELNVGYRSMIPEIRTMTFYADEELLGGKKIVPEDRSFFYYPILPIDK